MSALRLFLAKHDSENMSDPEEEVFEAEDVALIFPIFSSKVMVAQNS